MPWAAPLPGAGSASGCALALGGDRDCSSFVMEDSLPDLAQ